MDEKELSPQESMDLIQSMIGRARKRYTDNSFYFLLWGWIVMLGSGIHFYLLEFTDYPYPFIGWSFQIVGVIASIVKSVKDSKKQVVSNYTDKVYGWLWLTLGVSMFTIVLNAEMFDWSIVPFILILVSIGTFVSGAMMQFRPLQVGGVVFWLLSFLAFRVPEAYQMLIMSGSMLIGYLIPGYIMKFNAKKNGV